MKMGKKIKRFLTVYTVSMDYSLPNLGIEHLVIGSYLSRGDAIRACADYILEQLERRGNMRCVASYDERIVDALGKIGMSNDDIERLLIDNVNGLEIPEKPKEAIRSFLVDIIGADGCFILKDDVGEYRFDVDENDVEGKGGLQLWTCITTGRDADGDDPDWCEPSPEVFLSKDEAVRCAIDDIRSVLEGRDRESVRSEIERAMGELSGETGDGFYEVEVDDSLTRRWDIWSTPLDIGDGANAHQRV